MLESYDWVVEPSLEVLTAINARLDAAARLNEECD